MKKEIDWTKISDDDARLATAIAKRAVAEGDDRSALDIAMDIEATHMNTPLRLAELLEADRFNFLHDINGIRRHLNRMNGELEGFFVPRFALPVAQEAR